MTDDLTADIQQILDNPDTQIGFDGEMSNFLAPAATAAVNAKYKYIDIAKNYYC